jgi:hypothetical protein
MCINQKLATLRHNFRQGMKKWIVWILVIMFLTLGCIYIFIPGKIAISDISNAKATITGEFRYISQEENWQKWWRNAGGSTYIKGSPFQFNGTVFKINRVLNNVVGIEIEVEDIKIQSVFHLIAFTKDSTGAFWQCDINAGNNPLNRITSLITATKIKKDMAGVLKNFTNYVSDIKNVYGLPINRTSTQDTTMLSATFFSAVYPTTAQIYSFFDTLQNSIQRQHGIKTGLPMLSVRESENGGYETQVAMPTNRLLQNDGKIKTRKMVPGYFIVSEVKGGPFTIREAVKQLDYYISDYKKTVMAKPFQTLVTNRLTETDTSKWITNIHIPVME